MNVTSSIILLLISLILNVLNNTELWGPTHFHHFIQKMNDTVKQDIQRENYNIYNILMILTDGIIEDMDDTINALVESSFLPIKCNNYRNWQC